MDAIWPTQVRIRGLPYQWEMLLCLGRDRRHGLFCTYVAFFQ